MSARQLTAAAALCLLSATTAPAQQQRQAFALVIGITGYPNFEAPYRLHFADADARAFADFIETPEGGGFPRGNVYLLVNETATRTAITQKIALLASRAGGDDMVYVFFSGHGIRDDREYAYFMPYDADDDLPSDRGIRADAFIEDIRSKVAVKHLVFFIDACYAGATFGGGLAKGGPGGNVSSDVLSAWDEVRKTAGDVSMAFLSARSNQRSYEDSTLHQGVFTWFLLKGLGGAADASPTGNGDGVVTAQELNLYLQMRVEDHVQKTLGKTQSPITSPNFVGSLELKISAQKWSTTAAGASDHFHRAYSLAQAGDSLGAMREYREAIRLDPTYSYAYNNLANIVMERPGLQDSAIALYRRAIRLDPGNSIAQANLGSALRERGDLDGAVTAFLAAIRLKPDDAYSHNWLGVVLRQKGDVDGAIREFQEAIRINPRERYAHRNLGLALLAIGDLPGASAALDQGVLYYPTPALARADRDSALALRRSLDQRIGVARDTFARNPRAFHGLLVLLHEEAHDYEQSYALLQERLRDSPQDLDVRSELAEASFTSGRFPEADALITALLGDPGLEPRRRIVLRALQIANLHALGRSWTVPVKLRELADVVAAQPESFDLNWQFAGAKFSIRRNPDLAAHRTWLLELLTALERGRRADILTHLPAPRPTARLEWIKCQGDVWCGLNNVDLTNAHFDNLEGVYVVWHGGSNPTVLRVGQGVIRSVLWELRSDGQVQAFADRTLLVTWASVPPEGRGGLEKYLVDALSPRLGDRFPYRTPVVANLPW